MSRPTPDVLVLGSGIAGLAAALGAARQGASVTLATKATQPRGASTWWAQGGIAVARRHPEQLKRDIETASSDTSDPVAVDVLVQHADAAVRDVLLDTLDVPFDTGPDDTTFDYGREAAHSADRILHVDASTGRHIHVPFLRYLASHDRVELWDDTAALDLLHEDGTVQGALLDTDDRVVPVRAGATVLATGGIGALYPRSTNPAGATGDGISMAIRAGARTADMEYVQFHPTVCVADGDPFLVSEAVRGEGALLRNAHGDRFMPEVHPDAELAPRDIVARAVERQHRTTGRVVLDVSPLDFEALFPDLATLCAEHDVDPNTGIPVVPAEHFLCGGIDVDTRGRTTLDRLYAVGECARTGVHGANRLASTSLLEGLVWGLRAGRDAADHSSLPSPSALPAPGAPTEPPPGLAASFQTVQQVMDTHVSLRRTRPELQRACATLRDLTETVTTRIGQPPSRSGAELRSACTVGRQIARAALTNETSVGCHYRVDPDEDGSAPATT